MAIKRIACCIVLVGCYVVIHVLLPNPSYGFRVNTTNSLPYRLFFKMPFRNCQRGMIVSFKHPLSVQPLVKIIKGMPGDTIVFKDNHVYVANVDCGAIQADQAPLSCDVVPEECVYLHGTHEKSFDSRYHQFGLVKIATIEEQLCPIF